MQDPDHIWNLIAKKLAGEASQDELKELEELLRQNPNASFPMEQLSNLWRQTYITDENASQSAFDKHLERHAKIKATARYEQQKATQATWTDRRKKPWLLYTFFNSNGVVNHYFKLTWRGLMRNKTFSFINMSGLAIGMASAVLILLWIRNEMTMDRYHQKGDRIYVMLNKARFGDQIDVWGSTPQPLAPTIKERFPKQVEEVTRTSWVAAFVLRQADKIVQTQGLLVDTGFMKMFDFPLVRGQAATGLTQPHSIFITQRLARQLFDDEEALGRSIQVDSSATFTVTGILKDLPPNTQFTFDYLVPWSYMQEVKWERKSWRENNTATYVMLKTGVTEQTASQLFNGLIREHVPGINTELIIHPLKRLWLYSNYQNGKLEGGRIVTIRLFIIIAIFILLIACINYMNLSTARSDKRSKEVGISKVVGANKGSLIGRFIGESILLSFFAGIVALLIVQLSLPWFNDLVGAGLFIPYSNSNFWFAAIGFVLFTGVIAGSYPAFYLSGYQPIKVLQRSFKKAHTLIAPRKILVVIQFAFAIILIIGTIVIYRQIVYGQQRDPGYIKDNLAFVYVKGPVLKKYEQIKQELLESKIITDITRTSSPVTDVWNNNDNYYWPGRDTSIRTAFSIFEAENHFIQLHGFSMIDGRDFNLEKYPGDTAAVILTETAVKRMSLTHPVGTVIRKDKEKNYEVIGVIKDFIPEAPYYPTQPIVIHYGVESTGVINVKLNPAFTAKASKDKITEIFKRNNPGYVVEYRVIEQEYALKFEGEIQFGKLAGLFSGLTIFISCLGLFALAACMAENRVKEIGVRKVLGASATNITTLLSKDFLKLIIISIVIASPLGWWLMNAWLKRYQLHADISWWVFVLTGLIALFIAAATVSYQAIKAAMANPARSLKAE